MRNLFTPIFLVTLSFPAAAHRLDIGSAVLRPFALIFFLIAVGIYFLPKAGRDAGAARLMWSYVFIALAIGFLVTGQFLKEKETFYHLSAMDVPTDQYITISGKLTAFPETGPESSVLYLDIESLEYHRKTVPVTLSIRLRVNGDLRRLHRGDRVTINAKLHRTRFSRNFFPNGMENYILQRNTHFTGSCKSAEMVTVQDGSPVWRFIGGWRNRVRAVIEEKFTSPDGVLNIKGVFLQAILLGERGTLSAANKEDLISAGVFHLLAISGAHIGIIALFSLLFLTALRVSPRKRYVITTGVLILFLVLSGFRISAERAVWMAVLLFIARFFDLEVDIFNIISFCGLLLLFRNPAQFLDAGYILTFTLTAAIVAGRRVFLPLMEKWETDPLRLKEFLCANLSASIASLPLSLFFFRRYSFAGFFAGLVLLPLTAVITALGILLIPLAPLSAGAARVLLTVIDAPLRLFFYIVDQISNAAGFFNIFRASPSVFWVLLILTAFFWLAFKLPKKHKIPPALLLLIGLAAVTLDVFHYAPDHLEVFYLDVGQGDSQVVVFPGGDALLIDGGGTYYSDFQVGKNIVLPCLLQQRFRIKWVAVSHFHPDHVKGIIEILPVIRPDELWVSAAPEGNEFYDRLLHTLPSSVKLREMHAPMTEKIHGCTVAFLYPGEVIREVKPVNDHSQVLRVSDGRHSFLFTGDIETQTEEKLVETICSGLRSTVIKAPHHGSRTSSGRDFLECVQPETAVFSYGFKNRFRFPHAEVTARYNALGISRLATARSGGIRIMSLPDSLKIETSR